MMKAASNRSSTGGKDQRARIGGGGVAGKGVFAGGSRRVPSKWYENAFELLLLRTAYPPPHGSVDG